MAPPAMDAQTASFSVGLPFAISAAQGPFQSCAQGGEHGGMAEEGARRRVEKSLPIESAERCGDMPVSCLADRAPLPPLNQPAKDPWVVASSQEAVVVQKKEETRTNFECLPTVVKPGFAKTAAVAARALLSPRLPAPEGPPMAVRWVDVTAADVQAVADLLREAPAAQSASLAALLGWKNPYSKPAELQQLVIPKWTSGGVTGSTAGGSVGSGSLKPAPPKGPPPIRRALSSPPVRPRLHGRPIFAAELEVDVEDCMCLV